MKSAGMGAIDRAAEPRARSDRRPATVEGVTAESVKPRSADAGSVGATGVVRRRRRGSRLEDAILDAAWAEVQAVGYDGVSMDRVAATAGTSKAVLYRRWRNRAELVLEALRRHRPMLSAASPDTGTLRGDVIALLGRISAGIDDIGGDAIFGLLDELSSDPDGRAYLHGQNVGLEAMDSILRNAARRGDVTVVDDLPARVVSLPVDLVRHELLVRRASVPGEVIAAIVDDVFLPLLRGYGRRQTPR